MAKGGGGQTFPAVFVDGETEIKLGNVHVTPTMSFKQFHQMLSHKIGLLHNKIFVKLVDRKKNPKPSILSERGVTLISSKVNFDVVCLNEDHYFVVYLKKPRKSRRERTTTTNAVDFAGKLPVTEFPPPSMRANPRLLQRNYQTMPFNNRIPQVGIEDYPPPSTLVRANPQLLQRNQIAQAGLEDLNDRMRNLRIQRENYEMAMARESANVPKIGSDPYPTSNMDPFPVVSDVYRVPAATRMMMRNKEAPHKAQCVECAKTRSRSTAPFHPCVNDAVVTWFTTRAGPIGLPEINSFHDGFGDFSPFNWKGYNPLWARMFCT